MSASTKDSFSHLSLAKDKGITMYDCWFLALGSFVCISISLQTSLHTHEVENNEKHKFMPIYKSKKIQIRVLGYENRTYFSPNASLASKLWAIFMQFTYINSKPVYEH